MIPAFLLKNPLASGLGAVAALAVIAAGIQTVRLAWTQSELADEKLAFADFKKDLAEESLRVTREAAAKSAEKMNELTAEVRSVGQVGAQVKAEIRNVQSSGGPCDRDPKWRAAVGGVQRILEAGNREGGKGSPGGGPAPALRGADAPRP